MKERDTPETDSNIWASIAGCIRGQNGEPIQHCYVPAPFARTLERQRGEAIAKLAMLEKSFADLSHPTIAEVLAQLNQARADDDRNNQLMVDLMRHRDELLAALEESLALNINWADSTEPDNLEYFSEYRAVIAQARAAIAAVKG